MLMMKNELFKTLIDQLMQLEEVHYEYNENNNSYVLDSKKEGDVLTVTVKKSENKDKQEFEEFVNKIPDDLFNEVWESLQEEDNLHSLNELYESDDYKKVINKFKAKLNNIINQRISYYKNVLC